MATFASTRPASGAPSDADTFSICDSDYTYPTIQPSAYSALANDDFGFDPVSNKYDFNASHSKIEMESPPEEDDALNAFSFDSVKPAQESAPQGELGNASNSIVRHGQVTPPRSNSETSVVKVADSKPQRQRRPTKTTTMDDSQTPPMTSGRKRRNTRRNSTATASNPEEDEKRKQSLEKNRLAAAKCRVNKKEKTEQLQRDSHDKACQNAFLSEQVMRMKEEIQQMNALLLQHANHEGCKSSDDIQVHLNNMSHDFYSSHVGLPHDFAAFGGMSDMDQDDYFSPASDLSMGNPPLPDFDRDGDFDVSTPRDTPMHDD